MKKPNLSPLILLTIVFGAFLVGFFAGRTTTRDPVPILISAEGMSETPPVEKPTKFREPKTVFPIDINRADRETIMELPGIDEVLSKRIIDYRTRYGPFRTVEELLNVEGIGKKKVDKIWDLITIGG
jgi:competence protein ComEA